MGYQSLIGLVPHFLALIILSIQTATLSSRQLCAGNYPAVRPVHLRALPAHHLTALELPVLYYFCDQIYPGCACAE